MQTKPMRTYSRKRKRSLSLSCPADSASGAETKSDAAKEAAIQSLPSPPTSSPRALRAISPNVVAAPSLQDILPIHRDASPYPKSHRDGKPNGITENEPTSTKIAMSTSKTATVVAQPPIGMSSTALRKSKPKKLTQLTLDLGFGAPTQKRCPACGMEYVPSNPEDAKLHRDFHDASVGGVDIGNTGVAEKWKVVARCTRRRVVVGSRPRYSRVLTDSNSKAKKRRERADEADDLIVEVGRHDTRRAQNLAKKVLGVVEKELGAVGTDAELWAVGVETARLVRGVKDLVPAVEGKPPITSGTQGQQHDSRKVYLYVQDSQCVGLCLAEPISKAFKVQPNSGNAAGLSASLPSSSIATLEIPVTAELGISRIWVSREFRGHGIARNLLDVARREFVYGVEVYKESVAFSQPTESGGRLARAWFGKEDGWLVYDLSRS